MRPTAPSPSPLAVEIVGNGGAPWWGVPVIAGVFLIVGAALGFWFNWLIEARKQRLADAVRWHNDIREHVAELLAAAEVVFKERLSQAAFGAGFAAASRHELAAMSDGERERTLDGRSAEEYVDLQARRAALHPDRAEGIERMVDGYAKVHVLRESISLIAPGAIRAAAEDLAQKLDELDGENAPQARDAVREAREVLVTAVRGQLGVLE